MKQYIDKSVLVAEIEKTVKRLEDAFDNPSFASYEANLIAKGGYRKLKDILSFLDTLEVKEVDNVWHNANETPKGAGDKEILVQFADSHASVFEIDDWEYLDHQTKWAYLKDLI